MDKRIEVSVKDYKSVKSADISLDGITVVTGINGCGKSSLSQLLYYSFYYANRFDEMADSYLFNMLGKYKDTIKVVEREVGPGASPKANTIFYSVNVSVEDKEEFLSTLSELFTRFLYYRDFVATLGKRDKSDSFNRVVRIIEDTLLVVAHSDGLEQLLKTFQEEVEWVFNRALEVREQRYYSLLKDYISPCLNRTFPRAWQIKEYGVPFVGEGVENVPLLYTVKRVAYIDTPMIAGFPIINGKSYWYHLRQLLNNTAVEEGDPSLYKEISKIMGGDSLVEEEGLRYSAKLSYKRKDGKTFELTECATGIRSFAILQLLLKDGFLQKDTLLIVDEPEAHLHPQWIVEYARMLVLLNKKIGVKFFIASHSTDMVSAIRYIAAKEGTEENLCFYLAEESVETPYEYNYRSLGLDIEPIFKSFNKSFDKIDEYGISE